MREVLPDNGRSVGLDIGLKSFVVDTDGNSVENFQADKAATKVKNIQRRLSRAKKGSSNRRKLRDKPDKANERINNRRNDFLHKLSRSYVNNYDTICVEDLDVKGLKERVKIKVCIGTPMMHPIQSSYPCFRTRLEALVKS
jgi:putative transposase